LRGSKRPGTQFLRKGSGSKGCSKGLLHRWLGGKEEEKGENRLIPNSQITQKKSTKSRAYGEKVAPHRCLRGGVFTQKKREGTWEGKGALQLCFAPKTRNYLNPPPGATAFDLLNSRGKKSGPGRSQTGRKSVVNLLTSEDQTFVLNKEGKTYRPWNLKRI